MTAFDAISLSLSGIPSGLREPIGGDLERGYAYTSAAEVLASSTVLVIIT
jgi:hypothetical protein